MNKKTKIIFVLYFLLVGYILLKVDNVGIILRNSLEYVKCGTSGGIPRPVPQLTTIAYTFLVVFTPLILIAFSIVTLIKSIVNGNVEEISKAKSKLIKKIIITAIIYTVAALVQFVVNRVASKASDKDTFSKCMSCFLYYSQINCPNDEKGSGNDVTSNTYTNNDRHNNRGSNRNSNSSNNVDYGDFSSDQIDGLARFTMSWEGGIDSSGNPIYRNFGECYALSPAERSITIGAGGWMGQTGQKLLKRIRQNYPDTFSRLDTAGISSDLDNADWGNYCVSEGSAKAQAILNIITSEEGKREQDIQIREDMIEYIKEANERFDLHDKKGIAIYMNVRHIFGPGNLQARLFDQIDKPYTGDKIYNFIMNSPNFNYLAGYKSRYKASKEWADKNL